MNIKIEERAKKSLDLMKIKYSSDLNNIINGIKELKEKGLKSGGLKNIGDSIYRKRVGRWRILFTLDLNLMIIWLIKIEKDTKKDYISWKRYILNKIK